MSKELIVSLNGREKKIAIIEDDVVTEFYVERGDENQGIVGNIYKGKVMKVLPGMQSAFVDIGLERDAFLYVSDFIDDEDFEGAFQEDRKEDKRPPRAERPERPEKFERGRPQRLVLTETPTVIEASEAEDQDSEATLEALQHIEEIIAEPVIEREPEEEAESLVEAIAPVVAESPRERRHRRLQYIEPAEEKEAVEVAVVAEVPEPVVEAPNPAEVVEAVEEEAMGRRRRRPRPKRGRGEAPPAEAVEVETVSATPAAAEASEVEAATPAMAEEAVEATAPLIPQVFEPTPLAEPGEPMERVSDDDLGPARSERKAAPQEELVMVKFEVEPTPEVHVGSLQPSLQSNEDFERISDDESNPEEAAAAPAEEAAATTEVDVSDLPLPDASAEIREKKSRAEFATRRGGRGRRRRLPASDETSNEGSDEKSPEAEPESTPAPSPAPAPTSSIIAPPAGGTMRSGRPVISDLLREGQEVLVQIAKEPIGQKGARITSHIVLPGRYVVYMPTVDHIGVSRKIGTDEERQRLKRTLNQLRAETNIPGGFIVRTAAGGRTTEELRDDVQYLARTWSDMRRRSDRSKAPAVVHRDLDLVQRILRDQLSSDFTAIRVDNEFEYERIVDFVNRFAPKLIHRVKLYTKENSILEEYGVQAEVDKAVKPRVWLRSGGYIVINQTEALVAIDVNTGKFVGRSNRLEDTIVKTNLEAAKEIARQIRLRDLGGIIILDFIDMEERRNRQRVMQALEIELRHDKSPSKILQFNDFGLVAITRKRVKQSLERTLCTPCAYCGGGGMVKSPQTICYELLAEVRRVAKHEDQPGEVILRVNPEVAKALRTTERDIFVDIESHFTGVVTIKSDPAIHQEQFDIALV
ncbi:MAG: Rne/Rng family ribonuclease [Blastocatellia bacterium]|nr:Rne/Rng family ribonuclease [Blastocatellia bacterium]